MAIEDRCQMTWEAPKLRWRKLHRGKLYIVSCRALGVPETKADSYLAANAWWATRRAEIDGSHPVRPNDDLLTEMELRRDVCRRLGAEPEAGDLDDRIALVRAMGDEPRAEVEQTLYDLEVLGKEFGDDSATDARIAIARRNGIDVPDGTDPSVLDYLFGDRRLRLDREVSNHLDRLQSSAGEAHGARAVAAQVDRYLGLERVRVEAGQLSVSEFDTIRRCLHAFRDWIGGDEPIDRLDAERLEAWWSHLVGLSDSIEYKKKKLRYVRAFILWLAEKGLTRMALPESLRLLHQLLPRLSSRYRHESMGLGPSLLLPGLDATGTISHPMRGDRS